MIQCVRGATQALNVEVEQGVGVVRKEVSLQTDEDSRRCLVQPIEL